MQAARDRKKSYADLKCKPMEFEVGDKVMLKVSPWKGVVHFGRGDPIILCIAPRLWPSGLSSVVYSLIGVVLTLALTLLGTYFFSLEGLKGLILNIPGAITLSCFTIFDSCGVGTEYEVTGFDKSFVSSTF
ncbi:hypothetical protein Tco_0330626 [Tanacetum coccineum]